MEQNEFCPYCDHFIEEGIDPIIDFPCLHRAHSTCFLQLLNNETYSLAEQSRRCQFCEVTLFETQEEETEDAGVEGYVENQVMEGPENQEVPIEEADTTLTYSERIRKRVQENEQMQRDIKAYIKAKRACGPKRAALQKFVAEKKQEIKHSVDSLREQLGSLVRAQKNIIRQSQSFKDYKGAFFRVTIMKARISKLYNLDMDSLRRALRNETGFRQMTRGFRYRDSPSYVVRKAFYRRYIRC